MSTIEFAKSRCAFDIWHLIILNFTKSGNADGGRGGAQSQRVGRRSRGRRRRKTVDWIVKLLYTCYVLAWCMYTRDYCAAVWKIIIVKLNVKIISNFMIEWWGLGKKFYFVTFSVSVSWRILREAAEVLRDFAKLHAQIFLGLFLSWKIFALREGVYGFTKTPRSNFLGLFLSWKIFALRESF